MALTINDRVKETSSTTGTGTLTFAGAVSGFETFAAGIGNSNTTYYAVVNTDTPTEWEVGLGTLAGDSSTIARTTVISSSNSDSAVDFGSGTKEIFCTLPASKAIIKDASGDVTFGDNDITNVGDIALDSISNDGTDITLDSSGDIILDAAGDTIFLKDAGTTFGSLDNSSSNLIIKSGTTTAATFSGANVTLAGTVGSGAITSTGVVIGTTVEPNADTSASDNAAIGYTAAEGLILTGQGSTNDVTIKNDADAAVISIPTGATNVTIAGDLTISGDDLTMGTNTSGAALIADGTNFNPVVISSDATIATDGALTIANNAVSLAKMAGLARGKIIYGDSSGDPAALTVGSSGQALVSDGTDISWGSGGAISSYTNSGDNRIITSVNSSTVNGEANLSFDGSTLAVTGAATVSTTLGVTGILTGSNTVIGTTFEPTGDTAADDNAAIGYTAGEGLILTGQGSTSDVTLKNDADGTVFTIPTGTDDILFPDSAKGMWGTGSDLTLYHDGSNSYITNTTGALKIATESSGIAITLGHGTSEVTVADNLTVTGTLTGTLATAAQGSVTSLGTLTTLTVDNVITNGTTIGHTDDTDLMTLADGILTVAGETSMTTLDIGGTNVTSTAAELNILDGVTATAAELNITDGLTSTTAELNLLDGLDRGSILYGNSSSATTVLGQGSADQLLQSDGTDIAWATVETGASTTRDAVGTYSMAYYLPIGGNIALGGTNAGSGLGTKSGCISKSSLGVNGGTNGTLSGTWRNMDAACMTGANIPGGQSNPWGLWVRTA